MKKDVADRLLEHAGVYKKLEEKREQLSETIARLLDCYKCYHGSEIQYVQIELLQRLIWDIIRVDPVITSFYFSNAKIFGLSDLKTFGGIISERITERILKEVETQGLIKKNVNQ